MNLFGETDDVKGCRQRGHAGIPGTGLANEHCKTCRHYRRVGYHNGMFLKCGLMEHAWTHGSGTDIRAKDPACRFWEQK